MAEQTNKNLSSPSNKQPSKDELPKDEPPQSRLVRRTIQTSVEYAGPLPHPSLLREFDSVVPGSAKRIIRMAEKQTEHRQSLEKTVIYGDSKRAFYGLWVGAFVALCVLAGAVFLIYSGHDWAGVIVAGLDIVGLVSVFVYGTSSRQSERIKKNKIMREIENPPSNEA